MKIWVGLTDSAWFEYLSNLMPDEVNFWQPGGGTVFKVLKSGELFLFKLHAPENYIVGGGFFVSHSILPASIAWDAFGEKNGTPTFDGLRSKIQKYRRQLQLYDPLIGCIILSNPFFFKRSEWIPVPKDWSPNIVQGKSYHTDTEAGISLWNDVKAKVSLINQSYAEEQTDFLIHDPPALGSQYMATSRLGQGAFRILVTDAYHRRCAVTGERTLPVLEAAHIKPFSKLGPQKITNGLLLRSDLHKLYDLGYMTINSDYKVEVSRRIKEEFENGRDYYAFHGKNLISLPDQTQLCPSKEFIAWHNENVFMG